jgi:hypothetical protein
MKSMFWTSAPTGSAAAGGAGLRPFGSVPTGSFLPGCVGARLRAPEAFTAAYEGTGLPVGRPVVGAQDSAGFGRIPAVVDVVTDEIDVPAVFERDAHTDATTTNDGTTKDGTTNDGTTLGIHSPGRPPS